MTPTGRATPDRITTPTKPRARPHASHHPRTEPTSGRRGDPKLWQQFDLASDRHAKALQGTSLAAIGEAFGEISQAARAIARDVADHATSARKHA